jgi:hypothetical protein
MVALSSWTDIVEREFDRTLQQDRERMDVYDNGVRAARDAEEKRKAGAKDSYQ